MPPKAQGQKNETKNLIGMLVITMGMVAMSFVMADIFVVVNAVEFCEVNGYPYPPTDPVQVNQMLRTSAMLGAILPMLTCGLWFIYGIVRLVRSSRQAESQRDDRE
jgi:ABC-type dipeptide/oligopeptide/nickel transport system permease component